MSDRDDILAFAYLRDLHLTEAGADNAQGFCALVDQLARVDVVQVPRVEQRRQRLT